MDRRRAPSLRSPWLPLVLLTACLAAATMGAVVASASASAHARVTFVGDSVPASIDYTVTAERILREGFAMRLDLRVCRRLVTRSCTSHGSTPSTALEAIESYGPTLGDVLIVKVGYNDSTGGYPEGIDRVMRAALRQGARAVVWATLREARDVYHRTNVAIRAAARRWPQLLVADWNAFSSGRPWFRADGLHLSDAGAEGMARFLRPYVVRATQVS